MKLSIFTIALIAMLDLRLVSSEECTENKDSLFFYRMKKNDSTIPLFHPCSWLAPRARKQEVCDNLTDSYGEVGPAREVCKITCGICQPGGDGGGNPATKAPKKQKASKNPKSTKIKRGRH